MRQALYFFGVLWMAYVLTVRPINKDSHTRMLRTHTHLLCTQAAHQVWWGNDFLSAKYSHTPHAHSSSSVIWFYIRPGENTLKPLPTPKFSLWVLNTFEKAACVGCRETFWHPSTEDSSSVSMNSSFPPQFEALHALFWGREKLSPQPHGGIEIKCLRLVVGSKDVQNSSVRIAKRPNSNCSCLTSLFLISGLQSGS